MKTIKKLTLSKWFCLCCISGLVLTACEKNRTSGAGASAAGEPSENSSSNVVSDVQIDFSKSTNTIVIPNVDIDLRRSGTNGGVTGVDVQVSTNARQVVVPKVDLNARD